MSTGYKIDEKDGIVIYAFVIMSNVYMKKSLQTTTFSDGFRKSRPTLKAHSLLNTESQIRPNWGVLQNERLTYITGGHSRRKEVFTSILPEGMPQSILVSDCYSSYFSANVKDHQICTAHILRELIRLSELYQQQSWPKQMATLIRDAIHLKKTSSEEIYCTRL